jgi:hypothetical protein
MQHAGSAIRNGVGQSRFNGNYATVAEHALNDPYRYRFMPGAWKEANSINPVWKRTMFRTPKSWIGAGAGAAYGGAGAGTSGGSCGCP